MKTDYQEEIKELEEENKLLLEQLNNVQIKCEELLNENQSNLQKIRDLELNNVNNLYGKNFINHPLLNHIIAIKEMEVEAAKKTSLEQRVGLMALEALNSPISFLGLPRKIRRALKPENTEKLFGKACVRLIETYRRGGVDAVEREVSAFSPKTRAEAYAALAKGLRSSDKDAALFYTRKAWEEVPTPNNLKRLAFITHDAGDAALAMAMLCILPGDVSMSESEIRKVNLIKTRAQELFKTRFVADDAPDIGTTSVDLSSGR